MLRNDTENTYQLLITVGKDYLEGELRVSAPMTEKYRIKEKNHRMEPDTSVSSVGQKNFALLMIKPLGQAGYSIAMTDSPRLCSSLR